MYKKDASLAGKVMAHRLSWDAPEHTNAPFPLTGAWPIASII